MEENKERLQPTASEQSEILQSERTESYDQNQDTQKGEGASYKESQEEVLPDEKEKKAADQKGTDLKGQEKTDSQEGNTAEEKTDTAGGASVNPSASFSYTPPYYAVGFGGEAEPKKKKSGSGTRHAWIALLVVVCLGLSFVAGGFSGLVFAKLFDVAPSTEEDGMTVIKNDGSIKVNEKVGSTGYNNLSVSDVVALVSDSVVEITTTQVQTDSFFGNYVTGGAGSGVMIDVSGSGYILTNQHVIEDANRIVVRLKNGTEYEATSLGGDADFDIAVLKIEATGLPYATMGSSASLTVGEEVVAIGNPLGKLGGTVTDGIISALDRKITVDGHQMTLLQTNAAINPGNSGGGLFNMAGELIGIVNAKQSDTGIEGLGFAIPIDIAWKAAQDIITYGYVTGKPDLGFEVAESTTGFQETEGWNRYTYPAGVYVVQTNHDSLKKLDRIVSINGVTINNASDYYGVINDIAIGDVLEITVSRREGQFFKQENVQITVSEYQPAAKQ